MACTISVNPSFISVMPVVPLECVRQIWQTPGTAVSNRRKLDLKLSTVKVLLDNILTRRYGN
jgi:hypothetical protein